MKKAALCLFSLAVTAEAQTATVTALAPISVTASYGLQSQTATIPAGPLTLPAGIVATVNPGVGEVATGQLGWSVVSTPTQLDLQFQGYGGIASLGNPASVQLGPTDWVVELTNPLPVLCLLEVRQEGVVPTGPYQQTFTVDSGDDGSVEYVLGSALNPFFHVLDPTPWRLRIRSDTTLLGVGSVAPRFRLVLKPLVGVGSTPAVLGCDSDSWMSATPTFTGDLRFEFELSGFHYPGLVLVMGLSAQPLLLGAVPPRPCLLMPAPDLLVFIPSSLPTYTLPLPPAVRPVSFFAQAVSFDTGPLLTTNGLFVTAN